MTKHRFRRIEEAPKKGTLDQKHNEYIQKFDTLYKSLPAKKSKLINLKNDLMVLQSMNPEIYETEHINKRSQLMDNIYDLEREIDKIESCSEPLNYIVNTLPILVNYYDNKNLIEDGMEELVGNFGDNNKNNILNYLIKDPHILVPNTGNTVYPRTSKSQLYNDYLKITNTSYSRKNNRKIYNCIDAECNGIMLVSDGSLVCDVCGISDPFLSPTTKPNYKEPLQDSGTYAYKRINHLTEILSQLQAKETTDIPLDVFECIYAELKKRNKNKNDLDIFSLRRILKQLDLRKYYEHIPHILQIINGKAPPNFSRIDEAKIKKMFRDIQKPFAIFCPKNRKNFLNYSYVLHKFCELLSLDEYIEYFPLLKNNTKLLQHDKIWKNICKHMRWFFYKSL